MRVGVVREFMVKHTKNDEAISDQIDKEIKAVLRDKLGAELVESVDPMYRRRPGGAEHEVHVPGRVRRDPAAHRAGVLLAEDARRRAGVRRAGLGRDDGGLRASRWRCGKAPLSPKLNLRRISEAAGQSAEPVRHRTSTCAERGDTRVKDWASWVANAKFESDAQRAGAENALRAIRIRAREPDSDQLPEDAGGAAAWSC